MSLKSSGKRRGSGAREPVCPAPKRSGHSPGYGGEGAGGDDAHAVGVGRDLQDSAANAGARTARRRRGSLRPRCSPCRRARRRAEREGGSCALSLPATADNARAVRKNMSFGAFFEDPLSQPFTRCAAGVAVLLWRPFMRWVMAKSDAFVEKPKSALKLLWQLDVKLGLAAPSRRRGRHLGVDSGTVRKGWGC
jgi:hypothetical protein